MRAWKIAVPIPLALAIALPVGAQELAGTANLGGVEEVTPLVLLTWDEGIPYFEEETVRYRLQSRFELALRSGRVPISTDGANTLALYISLIAYSEELIIYSWRLAFEEMVISSRAIGSALVGSFPAYEAAIDTASSPSVPRMEMLGAVTSGETLATTWEGAAGLGTMPREELMRVLESRVLESAQEFVDAWSLANPQ